MLRSCISVLAGGVLAVSVAACSAGSSQSGCTQPAVQQYAVPQLITPASGSTNVPDNIATIQISTQLNVIVGTLSLVSPAGTIQLVTAKLAPQQPNPNAFLWNVTVPQTLKSATTYTITQSVTYPGACQGPQITQNHSFGTFTTQ